MQIAFGVPAVAVADRDARAALPQVQDVAGEGLPARGVLRSMEFVELNPMYDTNHQTAKLAIELALSALGKAIV